MTTELSELLGKISIAKANAQEQQQENNFVLESMPDVQQFLSQNKEQLTQYLPELFDLIDTNVMQNIGKEKLDFEHSCYETAGMAWVLSREVLNKLIDKRNPLSEQQHQQLLARHKAFFQSLATAHFTEEKMTDYPEELEKELYVECARTLKDPEGYFYTSSYHVNVGYFHILSIYEF